MILEMIIVTAAPRLSLLDGKMPCKKEKVTSAKVRPRVGEKV